MDIILILIQTEWDMVGAEYTFDSTKKILSIHNFRFKNNFCGILKDIYKSEFHADIY